MKRRLASAAAALMALMAANETRASSYETLFTFQYFSQGVDPNSAPLVRPGGAIYGTTMAGGLYGTLDDGGVAYKLTPPSSGRPNWIETPVYSFSATGPEGRPPYGPLIADRSNRFYGLTPKGVFRLNAPAPGTTTWTTDPVYVFDQAKLPVTSAAVLALGPSGEIYGTGFNLPYQEGSGICCSIFRLTPPTNGGTQWTVTLLKTLIGHETSGGRFNRALLVRTVNGRVTLFGLKVPFNPGPTPTEVYKLEAPLAGQTEWVYSVLYQFPARMRVGEEFVIDRQLNLFGTVGASNPSGTLAYKLAPPAAGQTDWTFAELYRFVATTPYDGVAGSLVEDDLGKLHVLVTAGFERSKLVRLTPRGGGVLPWNAAVEHVFAASDGTAFGLVGNTENDGTFAIYGLTTGVYVNNRNKPTVFRYIP